MDTDGRVCSLSVPLRLGLLDKRFPKARPLGRVFGERILKVSNAKAEIEPMIVALSGFQAELAQVFKLLYTF